MSVCKEGIYNCWKFKAVIPYVDAPTVIRLTAFSLAFVIFFHFAVLLCYFYFLACETSYFIILFSFFLGCFSPMELVQLI